MSLAATESGGAYIAVGTDGTGGTHVKLTESHLETGLRLKVSRPDFSIHDPRTARGRDWLGRRLNSNRNKCACHDQNDDQNSSNLSNVSRGYRKSLHRSWRSEHLAKS